MLKCSRLLRFLPSVVTMDGDLARRHDAPGDNQAPQGPLAQMKGSLAPELELELSLLPHETIAWQRGPVVGSGRFGQVMVGLRVPSAEFIAVKQIFIQEECDQGNDASSLCMQRVLPLAKIEREAAIVQSIQHPNVVHFLGCERHGPIYRIFMEYVAAGSLSRLLKQLGPFDESAVRHFVRQVLDGIAYLHRVGIAHRDLKCANLLLADDGTVKISDFGSAKRVAAARDDEDDENRSEMNTARSVREGLGSPYWMAPEMVRAERGDDGWRKADVWGVGCVAIELLTGKPPWDNHSNPMTAMFHIASEDAIPPLPSSVSPTARSFLLACFDKTPTTRPDAAELLRHPFITGETDTKNRRLSVSKAPEDPSISVADRQDARDTKTELASAPSPPMDPVETHPPAQLIHTSRSSSSSSSSDQEEDSMHANEDVAYSSDEDNRPEPSHDEPHSRPHVTHRPSATLFTWVEIGRVRALADYTASDENELSLTEGETMAVAGANEFGWWRGKRDDTSEQIGWFPCTYVEWIPDGRPFPVRKEFTPIASSPESSTQLSLTQDDRVEVLHCEWRGDQLCVYGRCAGSARAGWFPFMCIVELTVY